MVSRFTGIFRRNDGDEIDCNDVRNMSSDLIDGELASHAAERVEAHVGWCGPCNAFIRTLRNTVELLRNTPKTRAPSDFERRIRDKIENAGER